MTSDLQEWARAWGVHDVAMRALMDLIDPHRTMISGTGTSEAAVQAELRTLAPRHGASLWRNNNGAASDETGRLVRYGLGHDSKKLSDVWKSSDLIGITPVRSTAPGQLFGVFTAVEVKRPGWTKPTNKRERAQNNFIMNVRAMGGIGMFAQSTADYEGIFR